VQFRSPFRLARLTRTPLTAALLAVLPLAACDDDDPVTPPAAAARLKVVHAVADAPPVDVRVDDGAPAVTALAFAQSTPTYLSVPSGERRLRVNPTGTQTSVIDARATLAPDADVTVVATGRVAGGAAIQPLVLADTNTAPAAGQVRVRVVHAAATVGNVDVYVSAPGAALPATPTLASVPFRGASNYLAVPAGAYQVRVTPAGQRGTVAIDVTTPPLPAGLVAKAIAVDGRAAGEGPQVIFTLDRTP
jgi:hypothetical protein